MSITANIPLSTSGTKIGYYAGTKSGTPTSSTAFTRLHGIISYPDFTGEPEQIDATTFDDETYKYSISGLIDISGAKAYEATYSATVLSEWATAINAGEAEGKEGLWICIIVPGSGKTFTYFCEPKPATLSGGSPDELGKVILNTSVLSEPVWVTGECTCNYAGA